MNSEQADVKKKSSIWYRNTLYGIIIFLPLAVLLLSLSDRLPGGFYYWLGIVQIGLALYLILARGHWRIATQYRSKMPSLVFGLGSLLFGYSLMVENGFPSWSSTSGKIGLMGAAFSILAHEIFVYRMRAHSRPD